MTRVKPADFPAAPTETRVPLPEGVPESDREAYESELHRLLVSEAARLQVKQLRIERETASLTPTLPQRLDEMFATEPQGEEWLIRNLLQSDGSGLLSAQYKSGKTTMGMNLTMSLTTGEPFLGVFDVPEPLRVAYYDLELGTRKARQWFMDVKPDPSRVIYTDLKGRGHELDVRSESRFGWMVEQLRANRIDVVVIDPISAVCADIGINENLNEEVRPLLQRFDAVIREAGCKGIVVIHHTGHDATRFRGASAFGDWPSAIWTLERGETGPSKFKAKGRDVHVPKTELDYDESSRRLSLPLCDTGPDFLSMNQYRQLTANDVVQAIGISKPTAITRLKEAGWKIVTPGAGRNPDVWGYEDGGSGEPWGIADDPFAEDA
jgi:hypothetical protein